MIINRTLPNNSVSILSKLSNTGIDVISSVYALIIWLISYPYFTWGSQIPTLGLMVLFLITFVRTRIDKKIVPLIPIFAFLYFWMSCRGPFSFIGGVFVFFNWLVFILDKRTLDSSFKKYKSIFSLTIVPSLLVFVLIVCGCDFPFHSISPLNPLKQGSYRVYPFLVMYEGIEGFLMPRFNGYYDEPGLLGTISAILLITDKFNLRKLENWPILISGILSLSLFFFVMSGIYFLLFAGKKYLLLVVLILFVAVPIAANIPYIKVAFLTRFEFENGKLAGDNRSQGDYDVWFKQYAMSSESLIGKGGDAAMEHNKGGASYKDLIVVYGWLFFIGYCIFFMLYCYKVSSGFVNFCICSVVYLCLIYQRPSLSDYFYVFLLCGASRSMRSVGH